MLCTRDTDIVSKKGLTPPADSIGHDTSDVLLRGPDDLSVRDMVHRQSLEISPSNQNPMIMHVRLHPADVRSM